MKKNEYKLNYDVSDIDTLHLKMMYLDSEIADLLDTKTEQEMKMEKPQLLLNFLFPLSPKFRVILILSLLVPFIFYPDYFYTYLLSYALVVYIMTLSVLTFFIEYYRLDVKKSSSELKKLDIHKMHLCQKINLRKKYLLKEEDLKKKYLKEKYSFKDFFSAT